MSLAEFEKWERTYGTDDYVFGVTPSTLLTDHAALFKPGMSALMVADGEGRNGVYLASLGCDVTSFDISPRAIAKAQRLAAAQGVSIRALQAQAEDWVWQPARFDIVAGIFFQFAAPEVRNDMFAGMAATTAPGGIVMLRGYSPKQLQHRTGGPTDPACLWTVEMLQERFADGFEILTGVEREIVLNEGTRHQGLSAFVDFVARKRR